MALPDKIGDRGTHSLRCDRFAETDWLFRAGGKRRRDRAPGAGGEKVEREGGNSFRDYLLPEAVIRFRQGFGRLIRTKSDHGVVVITDPRLVTKNYGAVFRKSIPASVHTVVSHDELLGRVSAFFELES